MLVGRTVLFFKAEDGIRDYKVTGVQTCALPISQRVAPAPPAVGAVGAFSVCSNVNCTSKTTATATAREVGMHIAIFVDDNAPPGGLSAADLTSLRYKFDTLRSEEHTSELQSPCNLVCRLLLEK